jgi:hypothetical protein
VTAPVLLPLPPEPGMEALRSWDLAGLGHLSGGGALVGGALRTLQRYVPAVLASLAAAGGPQLTAPMLYQPAQLNAVDEIADQSPTVCAWAGPAETIGRTVGSYSADYPLEVYVMDRRADWSQTAAAVYAWQQVIRATLLAQPDLDGECDDLVFSGEQAGVTAGRARVAAVVRFTARVGHVSDSRPDPSFLPDVTAAGDPVDPTATWPAPLTALDVDVTTTRGDLP